MCCSSAVWRTLLVAACFAVPFAVLRPGLPFRNHPHPGACASFHTRGYARSCWNERGGPVGALKNVALWYRPLCMLAALGLAVAPRALRLLAVVPPLACAQVLVATGVLRMVGVGVPVLVALSAR